MLVVVFLDSIIRRLKMGDSAPPIKGTTEENAKKRYGYTSSKKPFSNSNEATKPQIRRLRSLVGGNEASSEFEGLKTEIRIFPAKPQSPEKKSERIQASLTRRELEDFAVIRNYFGETISKRVSKWIHSDITDLERRGVVKRDPYAGKLALEEEDRRVIQQYGVATGRTEESILMGLVSHCRNALGGS
jgi:hypothetical protein